MKNEKLYIIVPTFNRKNITINFLKKLLDQTHQNFEILIVDAGSTDGTAVACANLSSKIQVITLDSSCWWAASVQAGLDYVAERSSGINSQILIINDDNEVDNRFLELGLLYLKKNPNCLIQPTIYSLHENNLIEKGVVFDPNRLSFVPNLISGNSVNCLSTNGLFVHLNSIKKLGRFIPEKLPHYLSDYEYTIRSESCGISILIPDDLILRWNLTTSGHRELDFADPLQKYLNVYFSNKNTGNPVHWTYFVLICQSVDRKYYFIFKIWVRVARDMLKWVQYRFRVSTK
jgi:GT2 family glycosyltransferase